MPNCILSLVLLNSRMESNGMPGRIHVSQATADELAASGKSAWLTKREDLIEAKGKGKMQTYWVSIDKGVGSRASMRSSSMDHSIVTSEDSKFNPVPSNPGIPSAVNVEEKNEGSGEGLDRDRLMAHLGRGAVDTGAEIEA